MLKLVILRHCINIMRRNVNYNILESSIAVAQRQAKSRELGETRTVFAFVAI